MYNYAKQRNQFCEMGKINIDNEKCIVYHLRKIYYILNILKKGHKDVHDTCYGRFFFRVVL